jgi:hypothetical protein
MADDVTRIKNRVKKRWFLVTFLRGIFMKSWQMTLLELKSDKKVGDFSCHFHEIMADDVTRIKKRCPK